MPTYEYRCPNGHLFEKFYPTITATRPSAFVGVLYAAVTVVEVPPLPKGEGDRG